MNNSQKVIARPEYNEEVLLGQERMTKQSIIQIGSHK